MSDLRAQITETVTAPFPSSLALAVIDTIGIPILVLDLDLCIVKANRAFCDAFHLQRTRIQGLRVETLGEQWKVPELRPLLEKFILGRQVIEACEVGCESAGIGRRTLLVDARMTTGIEAKFETRIVLTVNDVTAARAVTRERDEALSRKETLLEEMAHRISNSLTIITALLQFKAKSADQRETRAVLNEVHHRILSIASVQHRVQAATTHQIALKPLLTALCDNLSTSMLGGKAVAVSVRAGDGMVDSAEAVSIGLIVTELVMNSLKHAFPAGTKDDSIVVTHEAVPSGWTLRVSDNGIGGPVTSPATRPRGLGGFIVGAMAKQLDAQVAIALAPGRATTLTHYAPGNGRLQLQSVPS